MMIAVVTVRRIDLVRGGCRRGRGGIRETDTPSTKRGEWCDKPSRGCGLWR